MDNIWAATNNLAQIPVDPSSPFGVEARKAIEMLQTAVVQQLNYSNQDKIHSTPYNSRNSAARSHHGNSPVPAGSSNANRQGGQAQPRQAVSHIPIIINTGHRVSGTGARIPDHVPPPAPLPASNLGNTITVTAGSRRIGIQCLGPAIRNERIPADFKGPRKVPNYTPDMEPADWIESYEIGRAHV